MRNQFIKTDSPKTEKSFLTDMFNESHIKTIFILRKT